MNYSSILVIINLFVFSSLFGQQQELIDSMLSVYEGKPGCAVGVFSQGKVLYSGGAGVANLDYSIPISPETVFDIGSISKQFTATCILLLEEEGKLTLDDKVATYLTEIPLFKKHDIRIHHLLHHTSGLRDYLLLHILSGNNFDQVFTEADGYDILKRQKALNFSPGEKFEYSNSGYMALALIVREVSGMSIGEYAKKHIFTPLQMDNSLVLEDGKKVIKNRAIGYLPGPNGFNREHHYDFTIGGDGQVYTSILDFFKWNENFKKKEIGSPEFYGKLLKRGQLKNGEMLNYASGIAHSSHKGFKTIGHTGSWGGSRAFYVNFPDHDLGVVAFCNTVQVDPNLCFKIADLYLPHSETEQSITENVTPKEQKIVPEDIDLRTLEGVYSMQEGVELQLNLKNDSLSVFQSWDNAQYIIVPHGIYHFQSVENPDHTFTFSAFKDGIPGELTSSFNGDKILFTRKMKNEKIYFDPSKYTGTYYSGELNTKYVIYNEEETLFVRVKHNPPVKLSCKSLNSFEGFGIRIQFNDNGGISDSFLLSAGPVKNISFIKID